MEVSKDIPVATGSSEDISSATGATVWNQAAVGNDQSEASTDGVRFRSSVEVKV